MEATDLMVGDWINVFDVPKQIEGIRKFQNGDEIIYYDGDNGNFIKAVTPIPITPEILEKNGFHAYSDVSQEWFIGVFKDGNKYLELTYSKGDIDWTINGDEYCITPIKYVHELQHALKLCRIEKEIVL